MILMWKIIIFANNSIKLFFSFISFYSLVLNLYSWGVAIFCVKSIKNKMKGTCQMKKKVDLWGGLD